ncbi:unnamed protein product, partial [Ostreobium quekettii]
DSGGPALIPHMVDNSYLKGRPELDLIVGVTSGGPPCDNATESIYTRVSTMRSWILSVTKNTELIQNSGLSALPQLTGGTFWMLFGTWFNGFSWVCIVVVHVQLFSKLHGCRHQNSVLIPGNEVLQKRLQMSIPATKPSVDMQPSTRRSVVRGVAESQHQEDSFDMPSIESHAHAPSANPGPLKQLPSPLSPKLLNFVQELGHSPFSTVYHATVHGADVAVKMVSGPVSTEIMEVCNAFLNKTICHPNVVSVLGVHKVQHPFLDTLPTVPQIGASPVPQDYGDNHCVWVLSEYCNSGSLETAIREGEFWEDGALDKPRMLDILFAARDIAQAVEHLHDNGFVHAHLTPRNVLLKVCCDQ